MAHLITYFVSTPVLSVLLFMAHLITDFVSTLVLPVQLFMAHLITYFVSTPVLSVLLFKTHMRTFCFYTCFILLFMTHIFCFYPCFRYCYLWSTWQHFVSTHFFCHVIYDTHSDIFCFCPFCLSCLFMTHIFYFYPCLSILFFYDPHHKSIKIDTWWGGLAPNQQQWHVYFVSTLCLSFYDPYAKFSPKMVNCRDIAGKAEKEVCMALNRTGQPNISDWLFPACSFDWKRKGENLASWHGSWKTH